MSVAGAGDVNVRLTVNDVDPDVLRARIIAVFGAASPSGRALSNKISEIQADYNAQQPVGAAGSITHVWPGCDCSLALTTSGSGSGAASTMTFNIPAATVSDFATTGGYLSPDNPLATFIAGAVGLMVGFLASALCAIALPAPFVALGCAAVFGGVAGFLSVLIFTAVTGSDLSNGVVWAKAALGGLFGAPGAAGPVIGWSQANLLGLLTRAGVWIRQAFTRLVAWVGASLEPIGVALGNALTAIGEAIGEAFRSIATSPTACLTVCGFNAVVTTPNYLRVLPFGDSITYGIGSSTGGGYRCDLSDVQSAWGMGHTFVGSHMAGNCAQPANEGRSGWTTVGLQSIEQCTISGYQPNVVLLDAGTNDINVASPNVIVDSGDPTKAAQRMKNLVSSIRDHDPGVVAVVGGLIPTLNAQTAANMNSFNQQVRDWIGQRQRDGWHVVWADMSAVTTGDLGDGLHPNDTGYQKMATSWSIGITQAVLNGWVQAANPPNGPSSQPPRARRHHLRCRHR